MGSVLGVPGSCRALAPIMTDLPPVIITIDGRDGCSGRPLWGGISRGTLVFPSSKRTCS